MIAHRRNPHAGPIGVSELCDRGASRHHQGVVELENWIREISNRGCTLVERQKQLIARASHEAGDGFRWRRVLHDRERNTDTCCISARGLDPYRRLQAVRTLAVLRKKQSDPKFAGANKVRNARVSRLRLGG